MSTRRIDARRASLLALLVAALGAIGVVLEALDDPTRALLAWIAAYGFGLGTALGALVLIMTFHLTGARWPLPLAPRLTAIAATLPVFAVLFVPIALGLHRVFPWANEAHRFDAPVQAAIEHQRAWNEPTFFLARALGYLATWCFLALLLRRAQEAHARAPSERTESRQRRISGAGLPIVALTMTFASFDWFMSLEPGWVSNAYGLYFFCGGLMSAVSLLAILARSSRRSGRADEAVGPAHIHAIGRLMLMAVILWAYIGFFQLMLVWIADLPREVTFFVARSRGTFRALDVLLVLGHFVLPFFTLLHRESKRRAGMLAAVGAWLVLMNAVDVAWLVLPAGGDRLRVLDAAPFLVVAGLAFAHGARRFRAENPP